MSKKKHKRLSKALRPVRIVEAVMLGEEPPTPRVRLCVLVPLNVDGLAKLDSTTLRAMAFDLQLYDPPKRIAKLYHRTIAEDVNRVLSTVDIDTAPGTLAGLLTLGTHRLRRLAMELMSKGDYAPFLVPSRREDLTDEEVAQRVLHGLKEYDTKHHSSFSARPDWLKPEDLVPPVVEPPLVPKAKTLRLFEKRRAYVEKLNMPSPGRYIPGRGRPAIKHVGPGRNKSSRARKIGGKRQAHGHVGSRKTELRCGCQVTVSISRTEFVWLEHVQRPCAAHAKTPLRGALHVSLLKKDDDN